VIGPRPDHGTSPGTGRPSLEQTVEGGILTGMLASLPAAALLMFVSGLQGRGLFTPAYRIANLVDADILDTALRAARAGDDLYFAQEPFFFGAAMHLFTAAALGAGFAVLARALGLRTRRHLVRAGALYGVAVLLVMGLVVLPVLGHLLDLGRAVTSFAGSVGWPAFVAAHLIYGALLGWWSPLRNTAAPGGQAPSPRG
jgi:hypothetical protein